MRTSRTSITSPVMLVFATAAPSFAAITMPSIISDNMVLQRDAEVAIWGRASPGERITAAFAGQTRSAAAGADGRWTVTLDPMSASARGRPMTIRGEAGPAVTISNVLVGEVWLGAGQSNMTWQMRLRVKNNKDAFDDADKPGIRLATVTLAGSLQQVKDCPVSWKVCTRESLQRFSAVAWYFGRELHRELGVPVGIVVSGFGGAQVQAFTDLPTLKRDPDYPGYTKIMESFAKNSTPENHARNRAMYLEYKKKSDAYNALSGEAKRRAKPPGRPSYIPTPHIRNTPTAMYYGMTQPLMPFRIKGAIWYQGENNVGDGYWYRYKLAAMVRNWRQQWGIGDFSFYIAQLAGNGRFNPDEPCERAGWAEFREAQTAVMDLLPNVGTATLVDVGETGDVHAWNKYEPGRRLSLWALAKDYGRDIVYSGPVYRSHRMAGNKVIIAFDSVGKGLTSARLTAQECSVPARKGRSEEWAIEILKPDDEPLVGFAIFDADPSGNRNSLIPGRSVVHARAKIISRDTVEVWSDEIAEPEGVRYAWAGYPKANLYNLDGLPTLPFRTDTLPLLIQGRKQGAWGEYTDMQR